MELYVTNLGIVAQQILSQDQDVSVLGVTSRGLFLITQSAWVLFVTDETYRGPLTLNLERNQPIIQGIKPGITLQIRDGSLFFPASDLWIVTGKAEEWKPCDPSPVILPSFERQYLLSEVSEQILTRSKAFTTVELEGLHKAIHSCNEKMIVDAIIPLLGRGNGLTPSGDDLIVGLLLTLNRWGKQFYPALRFEGINQPIIQAARQSTTTLSSSLIECATQAQADERLVLGIDSLVTGKPELATCIACLRGYGSSSGGDAFQGMMLALL